VYSAANDLCTRLIPRCMNNDFRQHGCASPGTPHSSTPTVICPQDMGNFTYRHKTGTTIDLPIFCWYIEGSSQRILVDTGANAFHMKKYRNFDAQDINTFEDALAKLGLQPDDIDVVIQTHLMLDHCANTRKCTKARVVVQQAELNFALAPPRYLPLRTSGSCSWVSTSSW
jgi:glyoxylase-like metal-dependent hydrolase (beta-lactamase superfamily II)